MSPAVSVVIPCFNHGPFIGPAVESVLATEGIDLEVIVVDDGSTDDSRERLRAFSDDPRVRIHEQENRGAHAALNRGIDLAGSELVFILNSDDLFDPRRIPLLVDRLDTNPGAALAASWIEVIDARGQTLGIKQAWHSLPPWPAPSAGPLLSDGGDPVLALLETNWISTTSNLAFRRDLVRDHGLRFAPLRYAHDWDFILRACALGGVELVEEPLLRYRVHGDNTIGEGADEAQGLMRFEIMWVVARHAHKLLLSAAASADDIEQLRETFWRSAPIFGCDAVLEELLLLRGTDEEPPAAYDALLDEDHSFREAAIGVLQRVAR
jgi:glycosyltransferase involved in cell wall biosynthesis